MKYGFVKVAAACPKIKVADCMYNARQITECIKDADEKGVHLLVLPELCITAYTCSDLFLQDTLLEGAQNALQFVLDNNKQNSLLTVIGLPVIHGNSLYNCAAVIQNDKILGLIPKSNLPNYGEFYERRQFTCAPKEMTQIDLLGQKVPFGTNLLFRCASLPQFCLATEICEDLWVPSPLSTRHVLAGATVIANPSASDEIIGKAEYRRILISSQSARLACGYIYSDTGDGESTTDMVFSGHSLIAENGTILNESVLFENEMIISEIDTARLCFERRRLTSYPPEDKHDYLTIDFDMPFSDTVLTRKIDAHPFVPDNPDIRDIRCKTILDIQAHGLKKRIEHTGVKKAVIGISGGLDSCLALLVAVRAMDLLGRPHADVLAVTMPCFGTTELTKNNAVLLCEALGASTMCIDIKRAVSQHFEDIGHSFDIQDTTFENAQARERTQILMDLANKYTGLVVGTGDLSELALGWATYNGDHMSMYAVNASIPKTLIKYLVRYFADTTKDGALRNVLYDILDTPISPELLPANNGEITQKTEELVGPYELHDFFLYYFMRFGFPPAKIYTLACRAFCGAYDHATVLHWLKFFFKRFFAQQFKRSCLPDGPKVGTVTLSPRGDWRMPSDACLTLWEDELNTL